MDAGGLHLFLGPDRPRKLERLQELASTLRVGLLDRHDLEAASVDGRQLTAVARQQPAVGARRLIVVEQADRLGADAIAALLQHAPAIGRSACVVLLVERELSVRHPLARAAQGGLVTVTRFAARDVPAAKPFALVEALGVRDLTGSLQALRDQLRMGREPTEALGLVTWQVQRWVIVRRLLDAGYAPAQIASVADLRAWQVERLRAEVAGRSAASLRQALARCWQVDVEIKSGRALPWLAVEQLLIELCLPEAGEGWLDAPSAGGPSGRVTAVRA